MYKTFQSFLYLLIGVFIPSFIQAQPTFAHFGVEDGLINNFITDLAQDKNGCIWIATENGLSRFDGYTFTNFKSNRFKLNQDALKALYYDQHENKLWICGKFDGVYSVDCSTCQFRHYEKIGNYTLGHVGNFARAADGGIWMASSGKPIVHYNPFSHKFSVYAIPQASPFERASLFDDGKGTLYIGFSHQGLDIVDLRSKKVRYFSATSGNNNGLPGNSVYDIEKDKNNNIWLGTNMGLALYHPNAGTFTSFHHQVGNPNSLVSDHIYDLQPMTDGTFWISSDIGGISILNTDDLLFKTPSSLKFKNILPSDTPDGLASGNIRSMLQDKAGNIWIGNYSSGIDFLSHEPMVFSILPYKTNGIYPKYKSVWGLYTDREQHVWAGGENEVVVFKDKQLLKHISLSGSLSRSYVQVFCITEDDEGNMLFGLYDDGLLKYNFHTGQITRIHLEPEHTDVVAFFKDTDNSILIGTEYGI